MTINLITFASVLHKDANIRNSHEAIVNELERYFSLNIIDYTQINNVDKNHLSVLFIATGGVEKLVAHCIEQLPRPTIMLADGMQNSLAAALEISSWLRGRGLKSEILHGEPGHIATRIMKLHKNFIAQQQLSGARIGVIGTPSSWLIASSVDYLLAKRRWGVEYIDVQLERVYEKYNRITDNEVGEACAQFASRALACREASPEDLLKAMRLYRAIKEICDEEKFSAITLSCFKLIEKTGTTGCLALSLLNDDGIIAGCEGDLQSIFTLIFLKKLAGKTGFMANPSLINAKENEIILAHCTVGTQLTEKFIIRSHFETEKGIGIQGILPSGDITVVKCGGESLDEYFVASGRLVENTNYINMCRTQIRVKLNTDVSYFLKNPLGNHHMVIQGNYVDEINEFLQAYGCKQVN